jgi:hypothetical protein
MMTFNFVVILSLVIFSVLIVSIILCVLYFKFSDYIEFLKLNRETKEYQVIYYRDNAKSFAEIIKRNVDKINDISKLSDHELYNLLILYQKLFRLIHKTDNEVVKIINKYYDKYYEKLSSS